MSRATIVLLLVILVVVALAALWIIDLAGGTGQGGVTVR
jgi:hypothetical protein